jgi:Peptidase family M23
MSLFVQLLLLQIVLPAALLVLNAVVSCRGWLEWVLRAYAGLVLLLVLWFGGIWIGPPWWSVFVFALLHALWVVLSARRLVRGRARRGRARRPWLRIAVSAAILVAASLLFRPMLAGQRPGEIAIDLAMPLGPGRYLVTGGGSDISVNPHLMTLGPEPRFAAWRGQSFAVDIVGLNAFGLTSGGLMPREPKRYAIYGTDVLAPCAGRVASAVGHVPDQPVPEADRAHMAGNHVVLECGEVRVVMAHLMPGSLAVSAGAEAAVGDRIGAVGNSGNTAQPHLHLHVQKGGTAETPLSGEPRWFTVRGRFLTRGERFRVR